MLTESIAEIIALLSWIVSAICEEPIANGHLSPSALSDVIMTFLYIANIALILVMMILTTDWLVCVIQPLKYKQSMTRRRVKCVLAASWVLSFCLAIIRAITSIKYLRDTISKLFRICSSSFKF